MLADEGSDSWYYWIGGSQSGKALADGVEMEKVRGRWYRSPVEATLLEWKVTRSRTTGFALREGIAPSEQYPATITSDDWDSDDETRSALYERQVEQWTERIEIDAPQLSLNGAPVPDDGLVWTAEMPYELKYHPEFQHLFPGRLSGFDEALRDRLNEKAGLRAYTNGPLKCFAQIPDPRPPKSRRKADRRSAMTIEVQFSRRIPTRVAGNTRAEAVGDWDRLLASFIAEVDAVGAVVCESCGGAGYHKRDRASASSSTGEQ